MYIKVRMRTDARVEEVVKKTDDHFDICVKEKAVRNLANKRLVVIMRNIYPGKTVKIVSGHQSPSKIVAID
jgi:uncharacterized protein YggU (UPF0235/DUF167 family)